MKSFPIRFKHQQAYSSLVNIVAHIVVKQMHRAVKCPLLQLVQKKKILLKY